MLASSSSSSSFPLLARTCSLHVFTSINVVVYTVCSYCTLQASFVQVILYVRVLLFIFISFIFSCMTYMKIIGNYCNKNTIYIVKM